MWVHEWNTNVVGNKIIKLTMHENEINQTDEINHKDIMGLHEPKLIIGGRV